MGTNEPDYRTIIIGNGPGEAVHVPAETVDRISRWQPPEKPGAGTEPGTETANCLAREPSRGAGQTPEPQDSPLSAPYSPATAVGGALDRLADLDAQRLAALEDLARIHRERCEVVRAMRAEMGPAKIAEALGVSRQQVHRLLRGD